MARLLDVQCDIKGLDSERWGDDEVGEHPTQEFQRVLEVGADPVQIPVDPLRWGGECRVEVDLFAALQPDLVVRVWGEARLYEGASEDTGDLEDRHSYELLVPRTTTAHPERVTAVVNLKNRGFGGGDWGDVSLSLANRFVEVD